MSAKKHHIEAHATSTAVPAAVWALLSDVTTWSAWAPFDASELVEPGAPDPNGVGAQRRFRRGRRTTVERVVAFDPPGHFAYALVSGLRGVRDYRADVTLTPSATGGTDIVWRSSFASSAPGAGWMTKKVLEVFIGRVATALAIRASEDTRVA
jgi:hypothetical protein